MPEPLPSHVSRRLFLKLLALAGGGTALGGSLVATQALAQAPTEIPAQHQWVMVFDLRQCEGCVTRGEAPKCVEACNAEHFVPKGQEWLKVLEVQGPGGHSFFMPRPCMQCENPPCMNVCPVGATFRTGEGVVLIDHERCIGCRMCLAACPYGARSFNWDDPQNPPGAIFARYTPEYPVPHRRGTAEKCMMCAHRTDEGKLPACASNCPMYAIYLGDLVEDIATNGQELVRLSSFLAENQAYRFKEDLGTRPRVWYIPGHGQNSGHNLNEHGHPLPARSWQELGATLDQHGGHK